MVTAPEDPIEAIKRRNEERAQKLKEKIASGEFFGFTEAIDEIAEAPSEQTLETASEFDLSSFPPPPDTGTIPIGEEEPVSAPSDGGLDIEITPLPTEPVSAIAEPESAAADLDIEVTPQVEQMPVAEVPVAEPVNVEAPPPPPDEIAAVTFPTADGIAVEEPSPVDLSAISFDGDDYGDFPIPDTWEGEAVPAAEAVEPVQVVSEPEVFITAEPEVEIAISSVEETIEEAAPVTEIVEPELVEEPIAAVAEPIPEIIVPEPEPEIVPVETAPVVAAIEPEPALVAEPDSDQLTISVDIDVKGNNVRVRRENIDMEGTIDLFKKIIEKYEGR